MDEYIKREDVENMLENAVIVHDGEHCGYCTEYVSIDKIPAADVVEVKHGRWSSNSIAIVCSECGKAFGLVEMFAHYCPSCGAKMDLEE